MKAIAFQTKLESDTVHLLNAEKMIGKEVIITVVEVEEKENETALWKSQSAEKFLEGYGDNEPEYLSSDVNEPIN